MRVLIAGGGRLLYFLARSFHAHGHTVTIVDRDAEDCAALARRLGGTIVHGDASDPAVLEDAGVDSMEVVLAATERDEDNLAIVQLASTEFLVPKTVALVHDPDNEEVFRHLGVTAAVSTTRILAALIEERAAHAEVVQLLTLGQGRVNISEVEIEEASPVLGSPLRDLELPDDSLLACVLRAGIAIVPRGDTVLRAGDRVVLVTLPSSHAPAVRRLTGERR